MTPFVTGMRTRLENPLTEAENEGEKERRAQMRWRKRVLKGSRRSKGGGGQGRQKAQRYYYWLKFFVAGVDLPRAPADCAISLRSSRGSAPSNPFFFFLLFNLFVRCTPLVSLLFSALDASACPASCPPKTSSVRDPGAHTARSTPVVCGACWRFT